MEENDVSAFELNMLLNNEHDGLNAILELHPGAGGTESQDWAEMLLRMYQRYAITRPETKQVSKVSRC